MRPATHQEVGNVLYNLALLRREAGATAEAIDLHRRAHAVFAASLGADHPDVVAIAQELATIEAP